MFNWRRKNDGFSWEKHVRTTVLYRREKRRDNLVKARDAAAEGVKKAGKVGKHAGFEGAVLAKKAGGVAADQLRKAGKAGKHAGVEGAALARKGAHKAAKGLAAGSVQAWVVGTSATALALRSTWSATKYASRQIWYALLYATDHIVVLSQYLGQRGGQAFRSAFNALEDRGSLQPKVALAAGSVGFVAALGAAFYVGGSGFNNAAITATLIAMPLLALALLSIMHHNDLKVHVPIPAALRSPTAARVAGFTVLSSLIAGVGWTAYHYTPTTQTNWNVGGVFSATPADVFKGRAVALSGDTLRLTGRIFRLDGIEAPDPAQRCKSSKSKSWRCGRAAKSALSKLVRRRSVTCTTVGTAENGQTRANCSTQRTKDLASALVTSGAVFAEETFFNSYSTLQDQAREKRIGIWRGEVLRPADYRQAKWNDAKKARPDGCPIKGRVLRSGRKYVLPWSPRYRTVRVRNSRGERWFCSEEEAVAAGWKPSEPS